MAPPPLSFRLDFHDDPFIEQLKSFTNKQLAKHLREAIKIEAFERAQLIQNEINSRKNEE